VVQGSLCVGGRFPIHSSTRDRRELDFLGLLLRAIEASESLLPD
jgi:hypothetical protein